MLDQHDGQETLIDTEIMAGLAPLANIYVYSSQSDLVEDGLTNAIIRAIQDNQVEVLTVSYSRCESALGASGNYEFNELWQEAAAQGMSVVVAAGDTGSAACDDGSATSATGGLAVNGYASTPYNIAVGGTDFDTLASNFAQYVTSSTTGGDTPYTANTQYLGSALSYIPENPWNDSISNNPPGSYTGNTASQYSGASGPYTAILGSGGGASSLAYCATGSDPTTGQCNGGALSGYPTPPFQTGFSVAGAPAGVRTLPDVSMFAGDNRQYPAAWAFCSDNQVAQADYTFTDCTPASDGTFSVEGGGGTSASAAAFAGVLGMVVESLSGTRLGVANSVLYNISSTGMAVFHDVAAGNNSVPCAANSTDCGSNGFLNGYDAGSGYDLASGLGSADVNALITAWQNVAFAATTTTLQANGSTEDVTITHGTPVTLATTVTPPDATGTVTVQGPMGFGAMSAPLPIPLTGGAGSISTNALPGGNYQIYAYYPGDTTHSPSQSDPITVNVSAEDDTLALSFAIQDVDTGASLPTTSPVTFPFGSYGFLYVQPIPSSGSTGVPTGEIAISDTNFGFVGGTDPEQHRQGRVPAVRLHPGQLQHHCDLRR